MSVCRRLVYSDLSARLIARCGMDVKISAPEPHTVMYSPAQPFVVAAAQVSPVFLDRDATIERACDAIANAAARNARLVVFPELFVPG